MLGGPREAGRIQVIATPEQEPAGLAGSLTVVRLRYGTTVGRNEVQLGSCLITEPEEVQILDMRHGMIRAQAPTPRASSAFIEKLMGET